METDDAETENEADEEVWAGLEQKEKQKREENDAQREKGLEYSHWEKKCQ